MTDLRTPIALTLQAAGMADVSSLRSFLTSNPSQPLVSTGSGGAESAADFAALLYGARGGVATAMSPYTMNSLSEEALKTSKVLLVSAGGHNNDIAFAARRALDVNPEDSASFSLHGGERNEVDMLFSRKGSSNSFVIDVPHRDGFVSVGTPVAYFALLSRVFAPETDVTRFAEPESPYTLTRNDGAPLSMKDLAGVNNFVILHGSWGRPVAANIEGKLVESGHASASVYDYRNFCHGRFIYVSNHLEDSAVVLLVSPREREIAERTRKYLPASTKIVIIETAEDSPAATLDLLVRSTEFVFGLCDETGVSLECPRNPGRIDKRVPMWVPFQTALKKAGPLSIE